MSDRGAEHRLGPAGQRLRHVDHHDIELGAGQAQDLGRQLGAHRVERDRRLGRCQYPEPARMLDHQATEHVAVEPAGICTSSIIPADGGRSSCSPAEPTWRSRSSRHTLRLDPPLRRDRLRAGSASATAVFTASVVAPTPPEARVKVTRRAERPTGRRLAQLRRDRAQSLRQFGGGTRLGDDVVNALRSSRRIIAGPMLGAVTRMPVACRGSARAAAPGLRARRGRRDRARAGAGRTARDGQR